MESEANFPAGQRVQWVEPGEGAKRPGRQGVHREGEGGGGKVPAGQMGRGEAKGGEKTQVFWARRVGGVKRRMKIWIMKKGHDIEILLD